MSLFEEYLRDWVAPDGGGMIDPGDVHPPLKVGALKTTKNENPILFLVQASMEFLHGWPDRIKLFREPFVRHMESTRITTGLHSRRAGDGDMIRQSHDNIVGMVIGSWMFDTIHRHEIFAYGTLHGWNFNVGHPGAFEIECQLQGGDVALCHIATGRTPSIWLALWLAAGLAISKTWNLADLRISFLRLVQATQPRHIGFILGVAVAIHEWRRGPRVKWVQEYYRPDYPFRKLVEQSRS